MLLFGQILAALYQDDIVEEEDIRRWHVQPTSKGEGHKPSGDLENIRRCWTIGGHMIQQFNEQGSDNDSSEEGIEQNQANVLEDKGHEEDIKKTNKEDEQDEDDDEDENEEDEEDEEDEDEEDEEDEEDSEDEDDSEDETRNIITENDM